MYLESLCSHCQAKLLMKKEKEKSNFITPEFKDKVRIVTSPHLFVSCLWCLSSDSACKKTDNVVNVIHI